MRRGHRDRSRLAVALAVLAVTLAAPPASAGCAGHQPLADGWLRIKGPGFLPGRLTTYDVADHSAQALAVTDGTAIGSSADGGCTWRRAVLPAEPGVTGAPEEAPRPLGFRLGQVHFAPASTRVVWAIGEVDAAVPNAFTAQPRVYLSQDGGATFQAHTAGLPRFGHPVVLHGVSGTTALLLVHHTPPENGWTLYVSTESGAWQPLWTKLPRLDGLTVDFASPGGPYVWAWSRTRVYRARLTDPVLEGLSGLFGVVHGVEVTPTPAGSLVTVFQRGAIERFVSTDGGRTFVPKPAPRGIESVSSQPLVPGMHVYSTSEVAVLVETPARPGGVDVSPDGRNVVEPRFAGVRHPEGFPVLARDGLDLYRRHVPVELGPAPPPLPPAEADVRPPPPPPAPAVGIHPQRQVVRLRPGGRRVVDYTVHVPPVPSSLDLFFMTDSTGSMSKTVSSVTQGVQEIVDGLARHGVDLWMGVADFRDHSKDDPETYPYRRRRKVGPPGPALAKALAGITTGGGGERAGNNSGLEAIYQAVTGAGRKDPLFGEQLIPPGQGAEFRADAMKVVLVASDDYFRYRRTTELDYPGPDIQTVSSALVEHDVYLMGLAVETGNGSARADMERLADDTGALAPAGGVDCDDDGAPDLAAGAPLVCGFMPDGTGSLATAFVRMLTGIEQLAAVDLSVTGGTGYVTPRGRLRHPEVNVRRRNTFRLPVEFRCPAASAGTVTPVRISAGSDGTELVATTATLVCAVPGVAVPHAPPPVPPERLTPAVPLPAAPVAPAPQQQPPPHSNPNPNAQGNPTSGFVGQEDEEFEVSTANDEVSVVDGELAATGLERAVPPQPAVAWALAAVMTGAAAFGLHLTRRVRTAPAHAPPEFR